MEHTIRVIIFFPLPWTNLWFFLSFFFFAIFFLFGLAFFRCAILPLFHVVYWVTHIISIDGMWTNVSSIEEYMIHSHQKHECMRLQQNHCCFRAEGGQPFFWFECMCISIIDHWLIPYNCRKNMPYFVSQRWICAIVIRMVTTHCWELQPQHTKLNSHSQSQSQSCRYFGSTIVIFLFRIFSFTFSSCVPVPPSLCVSFFIAFLLINSKSR